MWEGAHHRIFFWKKYIGKAKRPHGFIYPSRRERLAESQKGRQYCKILHLMFFYSYEACFKGEIVITSTVADHPSNRRIVQSTKKKNFFFTLLSRPVSKSGPRPQIWENKFFSRTFFPAVSTAL